LLPFASLPLWWSWPVPWPGLRRSVSLVVEVSFVLDCVTTACSVVGASLSPHPTASVAEAKMAITIRTA
jgi:hypothetical protein